MSAFEKWFKAQHGVTPLNQLRREQLETKCADLRAKLRSAESALDADTSIRVRWTSALWAWNARASRPSTTEGADKP